MTGCHKKTAHMIQPISVEKPVTHGLINYIDTKAKCRHLQNFTCKGTVLYPPVAHMYTYLFAQERGGGVEPERRGEGQQITKLV
jgi:hypothetical protein